MNEEETLDSIEKELEEDCRLFSNEGKPERERCVASLFLGILGVKFEGSALESKDNASKIDVQFRECNFQVKEIMTEGFRRGKMYKEAYESVHKAKCLKDICLVSEVMDTPKDTTMFKLVCENLDKYQEKYTPQEKENLDLLFYITRPYASLLQVDEIKNIDFSSYGWRSILCVNEKQAGVLFASPAAPSLIKKYQNKIVMRALHNH